MVYRFDGYELDLDRHQLRRGKLRIRLTGAPMDLLVLLVERRGTLLKRNEIAGLLWSEPEMVDVDQGINTAIRRIREALRDDPSQPRFIETVIGKGYRFIPDVEEVQPAAQNSAPAVPTAETPDAAEPATAGMMDVTGAMSERARATWPIHRHRTLWLAIAACAVLAGALVLWRTNGLGRREKDAGTFSQITFNDNEECVTAAAISPDGKWIVYADLRGLSIRVLENQSTVPLEAPPHIRAEKIAWYPGQAKLLLSGFNIELAREQIWAVSITGGHPTLFLDNARNGVPSPDGSEVAFTTNADRELWVAGSAGEGARRLDVDQTGKAFASVFWSGDGRRVGYVRQLNFPGKDDNYESMDVQSGKITAREKNFSFESAYELEDGRFFFLRDSASNYHDAYTLWEAQTDKATGALTSAPRKVDTLERGRAFGISGTSDGVRIAVVLMKGNPHIYVATLSYPGPVLTDEQRLTFDTQTDYPHAWLYDNSTVIYESNRTGTYRIYKERLADHRPTEFTTGAQPAVLPNVTPDGKWILYAMKPHVSPSVEDRLYRISVDGGTPAEVPLDRALDEFACSTSSQGICVLRETTDKALIYYALDPVKGKGPEIGRTEWLPHVLADWAVAPDGSAVALVTHDAGRPRIRIVPLRGNSRWHEQEYVVPGFGKLSGVNWVNDNRGWFVTANTGVGSTLLYMSFQGETHVLRDSPSGTWGVPSPDGKKLAMVDQPVDSNVWMWQFGAGKPAR